MTALAFSEQYLFTGQGPFLKVHSRHDNRLLLTHKVFVSQAIHGIEISDPLIIVWGGPFISIYHSTSANNTIILRPAPTPILKAEDWILDISISPYPTHLGHQTAAVLTAHNALLLLDPDTALASSPTLTDLTSTSRCILYSADLCWLHRGHVLIASGTVFGEIILWSCLLENKASPRSVLHQLLSGHEGSIFGVRFFESPIIGTTKRPSPLLASCSDDRTIRIWDISGLPDTPLDPQAAADLPSARETGFGVNIADVIPDQAVGGHCIAKAWGHASRIWDIRFLPPKQGENVFYLASFGEDATAHLWRLAPHFQRAGEDTYALTLLGKTHVHSGKNIWSSAVAENDQGRVVVATGGADGSVVLSSHNVPVTPIMSDSVQTWSLETLSAAAPLAVSKKPDKLRGYAFIDDKSLIVSTDSGNVFLLESNSSQSPQIDSNAACKWISHEPKLRGYSVVASLPGLSVAFLAGMDGTVLVYETSSQSVIRELTTCSGKTAALFARQLLCAGTKDSKAYLLVANFEAKQATLLQLSNDNVQGIQVTAEWTVDLPVAFTVTAFLLVPTRGQQNDIFSLYLGSRNGALARFTISECDSNKHESPLPCDHVVRNVHGNDAVTDLGWVPDLETNCSGGHIFSVGRDGTFVVLQSYTDSSTTKLLLVNQTSLPIGMLVEGLHISEERGTVSCWGFHSRQFVVVDMIRERDMMSVDCGGANRLWKFEPSDIANGGTLAWTKASQLCRAAPTQVPPIVYDGGSHGREIKAVAVRPITTSGGLPLTKVFATGSEDTNIKIFVYDDTEKPSRFRCLRTLRKHNTGTQNLQWSSDGQYLFSSGGFEEFFVWRIETAPLIDISVVCESVCPTESDMPDLRIMSFSARQIKQAEESPDRSDFIISMVRSDSTIRVYSYISSRDKKEWRVLFTGNYLTSCLTQCLDMSYANNRRLITAGTDGHIALWPMDHPSANWEEVGAHADPMALPWALKHQVHQSAIHCLSVHWIKEGRDCILMSGGDDCAFAITRCTWEEGGKDNPKVCTLQDTAPGMK